MTVTRAWGLIGIWNVDDAEDRHVGTIYARSIVTSEGERLVTIERDHSDTRRLLDIDGRLLATIACKDTALELACTPALEPNPFIRMLVLGSLLSQMPMPDRVKG